VQLPTVLSGFCVKEAGVNAVEDINPVVQHLICYPDPGITFPNPFKIFTRIILGRCIATVSLPHCSYKGRFHC